MPDDGLWLRKALVAGSALIYWIGVLIQAYRVQRRIGRSPNVMPHGMKERLLWLGWMVVLVGWVGQPLVIGRPDIPLAPSSHPGSSLGTVFGMAILAGGYVVHSGAMLPWEMYGDWNPTP